MQPAMSFSRENIIPIDNKLHTEALNGRFVEFERYADSLDRFLTTKQDTILHIHLNTMDSRGSTYFAQKVFDKCPQLIKQTNENGDTPLHIAARYGHSKIAKFLIQSAKTRDIESGIEAVEEARKLIRMVNNDKDTALHEAVRWDNDDVVKIILGEEELEYKYGVNNSGETPLYLAARCCSIRSLIAMLDAYEHKPVAYQGPNGKTVLHAAIVYCSRQDFITFKIIKNMGMLVNEADEHGWTPLHYAVCFPNVYVVSKLIEKGTSSAYLKDDDRKMTPLHLAACLGNTEVWQCAPTSMSD